MRSGGGSALKKGAWTTEEDALLKKCIHLYGEGNWHKVPIRAGLNRCRKSCRLRWHNYLNPDIKRGTFSSDEIDLIIRMHKLLGNRWSLIAGRIPGRTANDVKNQWNSHIFRKLQKNQGKTKITTPTVQVIKPKPLNFSKNSKWIKSSSSEKAPQSEEPLLLQPGNSTMEFEDEQSRTWLEKLLLDEEDDKGTNNILDVSPDDEELFTSFYVDGVTPRETNEGSVFSKEYHDTVWTDMCVDLLLES